MCPLDNLCGDVTLFGLEVSAGGELLDPPARPERRIEFICDSITCGYGNEETDGKKPFTAAPETNDFANDDPGQDYVVAYRQGIPKSIAL